LKTNDSNSALIVNFQSQAGHGRQKLQNWQRKELYQVYLVHFW